MKFIHHLLLLLSILQKFKTDLATTQAIKKLILNSNYDNTIQPQDLVKIKIGLAFKQIVKLDQTSQILTSSSFLICLWIDQRLSWNITEYQKESIILKANQIWLPDLYVINSGESNGFLQVNDYSLATVTNDGFVIMAYPLNSKFILLKVNN